MELKFLFTGKLKEPYLKAAEDEYISLIARKYEVNLIELADISISKKESQLLDERMLNEEAKNILAKIDEKDFVIILDLKGELINSSSFNKAILKAQCKNKERICFIVGSSLGLSNLVKNRADLSLKFSNMTFPHQLFRIVLLEAISMHI